MCAGTKPSPQAQKSNADIDAEAKRRAHAAGRDWDLATFRNQVSHESARTREAQQVAAADSFGKGLVEKSKRDYAAEIAAKAQPDMASKLIEDAQAAETRRQRAKAGRAASFLTGAGGTMANSSLLTGDAPTTGRGNLANVRGLAKKVGF